MHGRRPLPRVELGSYCGPQGSSGLRSVGAVSSADLRNCKREVFPFGGPKLPASCTPALRQMQLWDESACVDQGASFGSESAQTTATAHDLRRAHASVLTLRQSALPGAIRRIA